MSAPLSRLVALACAVLVLGAATTASARPKKHSAEKHSAERTATATTNCYGTPIIMQGMDCPKRSARAEEPEPEQPTNRAQRHRLSPPPASPRAAPPAPTPRRV